MEIVEAIEYHKHEIQICYDDNAESPREWDNLGTFAFFHKKYNFGDKVDFKSEDFDGWLEMENHILKTLKAVICLTVCMYDHSGQTIYIGTQHDRWDGGRVGFIYVTKEQLYETYETTKITATIRTKAEEVLRNEIKTMDSYMQGEVYGYKVIDEHGENIDSCWGYYGDDGKKYAIECAKDIIDHNIKNTINKHLSQLKAWILKK